MTLYEQWTNLTTGHQTRESYQSFWKQYLEKEKNNYEKILSEPDKVHEGTLSELAAEFDMDGVLFTGFLDGINTSLKNRLDIESLTEDTSIKLEIDYELLYFNMLDAKADWLYKLPQWNNILSEDKRRQITKEYRQSKIITNVKIGRNEPCPCGSGKKYKKCCGSGK